MGPSRVNPLIFFFFPNCYPSHSFEHLCIPDNVLGAVKNKLTRSPFLEQTRNKQPLYPASGIKRVRALGAGRVGTHPGFTQSKVGLLDPNPLAIATSPFLPRLRHDPGKETETYPEPAPPEKAP